MEAAGVEYDESHWPETGETISRAAGEAARCGAPPRNRHGGGVEGPFSPMRWREVPWARESYRMTTRTTSHNHSAGLPRSDPLMPSQRLTQRCAGAAFGIALLAAAGWLFQVRFLAGQGGEYIPMAPSTALAFLLLSSGVFSHARWPQPASPLCWGCWFSHNSSPALIGGWSGRCPGPTN